MSEIRYRTCDHCGKKLDEMKDYIEIELDKYGLIVADLCAPCYERFNDLVKQFLSHGGAGGMIGDGVVHLTIHSPADGGADKESEEKHNILGMLHERGTMTTQEIIKSLRCCSDGACFTDCPMYRVPIPPDENLCCEQYVMHLAADELERLGRGEGDGCPRA